MSNKVGAVELVSVDALRIGLFVELDIGWLSHPFPSGSVTTQVTDRSSTASECSSRG
ncbi:MAG: hypothetical protein IPH35_08105 [Rhodoferax sp.]|nr:hypothetical protein [Rhodoferax sp.]